MSKEMREQINKVKNWKQFLNENLNNDLIKDIEESIDEKMDELIGRGDYNVGYSEDQDRFIISFREGDIQESCDMADEVVDFVNIERNILRVGNCGKSMFWLTWFNK
jgi:hypothetical protein